MVQQPRQETTRLAASVKKNKEAIASSCLKALGIWIGVIILVILFLVAWKRTTPSLNTVPAVKDDSHIHMQTQTNVVNARVRALEQANARYQQQLDDLESLESRIGTDRSMVQSMVQRLEALEEQLASAITESSSSTGLALLPQLQALLPKFQQYHIIRQQSTASFRQELFQTRRELHNVKQQMTSPITSWNWTELNIFLESFAHLDWSNSLVPDCSLRQVQASVLTTTTDTEENSAASLLSLQELIDQHPDIQEHVNHIQQVISERNNAPEEDWKVALVPTFDRIHARWEAVTETAHSQVVQAMKDLQTELDHRAVRESQRQHMPPSVVPGTSENQCVQPSQVLHWLDVGLDAYYRHRDIREALFMALIHDERVNESTVTLLENPHEQSLSSNHTSTRLHPSSRSWRLILDTPLTHQAASWLDVLVEAMEGKIDIMDQWIDGWAAQAQVSTSISSSTSAPSIGQWAVHNMLNGVGWASDKCHGWLGRYCPYSSSS